MKPKVYPYHKPIYIDPEDLRPGDLIRCDQLASSPVTMEHVIIIAIKNDKVDFEDTFNARRIFVLCKSLGLAWVSELELLEIELISRAHYGMV